MKPVASRGARAAVSRVVRVLIIVGALLQPSVEFAPADAPGSLIRPSLAPPIAVGVRSLLPPTACMQSLLESVRSIRSE